jgi:hypothetical protein
MLKVITKFLSFFKKEKNVESENVHSTEISTQPQKEVETTTPVVIEKSKDELEKIISERLSEIEKEKEAPKKDAPKKEAPKATPKKEAPKKDAPKKDAPKKDAPKKDAPKKDAPKKDAPKANPKKEAPKKNTKKGKK